MKLKRETIEVVVKVVVAYDPSCAGARQWVTEEVLWECFKRPYRISGQHATNGNYRINRGKARLA
jgi:hypothetical protein